VCKVNSAAYVKILMPPCRRRLVYYGRVFPAFSVNTTIDIQHIEAYLYLRAIEAAHGEGKKAGSEERGAGARRLAQSQSRSRPRRSLRQPSILRRQGPGPGALRDGAASPGRRRCNQRVRRGVRRHPADLLQGPERPADGWARWSAAEPARSQGRPQDVRRGDGIRGRSQSRQPRADHLAMSRRDRCALRHQGAPAQPGARAGAQKKRLNPA
jgi:hypothetical protein